MTSFYSLVVGLWEHVRMAFGSEIGALIGGAIFSFFCIAFAYMAKIIHRIRSYMRRLSKVKSDVGRVQRNGYLREGKGLWVAEPVNAPDIRLDPTHGSPKVLIVANAKGGVGKTTVAANLAARFAELAARSRPHQKPILLIDLDFQGTLSAMAIADQTAWLPATGLDSDATYLISADWTPEKVGSVTQTAVSLVSKATGQTVTQSISNLRIIRSYYDLAQAENREMVEWLVGDRRLDVRFTLRELLWSKEVVNAYSMVIIDCPPRFTTASIQAIAAATHLLIPTKLDAPSSDAVVTFGRQIEILRDAGICSHLKYVGVVGAMVRGTADYEPDRQRLEDRLSLSWDDGGLNGWAACLPKHADIPESVAFRDAAGRGIAYNLMGEGQAHAKVRNSFRYLGHLVAREMNLPQPLMGDDIYEASTTGIVA